MTENKEKNNSQGLRVLSLCGGVETGLYASPEVGINVFPWVYGPGLHFALYYSYGTNKADVLHYSVDGLSNFGFRLGVSF